MSKNVVFNCDGKSVCPDSWENLRRFTTARIALGKCGTSLPTSARLDFQLCHARARDAVHTALDFTKLQERVQEICDEQVLVVKSCVRDRNDYLCRPDRGRVLDEASRQLLHREGQGVSCDIALVVADGLSATAIDENVVSFLSYLLPSLRLAGRSLAPLTLVQNGRVAIGDEVGSLLEAQLVIVLIGERPGLKSANSMGIYMTWNPQPGNTDERRNCISNVRPEGMVCSAGAAKLMYLINESFAKRLSGVQLKDRQTAADLAVARKELEGLLTSGRKNPPGTSNDYSNPCSRAE